MDPSTDAGVAGVAGVAGDPSSLWVDFVGTTTVVYDQLTFGREGGLVLDEANRFMHRCSGDFHYVDDAWWLANRAIHRPMVIYGSNGMRVVLPAGTMSVLTAHTGTVSFMAGPTPYELTYRMSMAPDRSRWSHAARGATTTPFGRPLRADQIEVLVEFARPWFTGRNSAPPTYAEVAQRVEISTKCVDHVLSGLRAELAADGIGGIDSVSGLVTHLVSVGRLTYSHLIELGGDL